MEKKDRRKLLFGQNRTDKVEILLKNAGMSVFEYDPNQDLMITYDGKLEERKVIEHALQKAEKKNVIFQEDFWKVREVLKGEMRGPIEVRIWRNGEYRKMLLDVLKDQTRHNEMWLGFVKDVTEERKREEILEEQAKTDSMTGLYHNFAGKALINEYLTGKSPYSSCGLMVIDLDYFKSVNDSYGHLFGDEVLITFSGFLRSFFEPKDILVRAGGDEFVVLLKDISHNALVKKTMQFIKMTANINFSRKDYILSCSVGVCHLPENVSGFTYEQLFENADWALYQAKINGRNRYVFCDSLKRFEVLPAQIRKEADIDSRYLRNDVVATAFEIFEKMNNFDSAIELLLKVIGIRFQLDRITVIQTSIKDKITRKQYQWREKDAPEALNTPGDFTREDFQTLFRSYDEYGTTVLQHDKMDMYSKEAQNLLMQGEAKTVVYAAMYCEGKYTGAISYVVCKQKRYWSKQDRKQLGELTKIISAHLVKCQAINDSNRGAFAIPDYDALTGLLSFTRFKEVAERLIVGGYAKQYIILYTDFCGFKYFNQKYGYMAGDQLLKEFSNYIIETLREEQDSYFTRVVADQFILFMPYEQADSRMMQRVQEINREFVQRMNLKFPQSNMTIRTGIYRIPEDCLGASSAIDAANYARMQIRSNNGESVLIYDDALKQRQLLENQIINGMDDALEKREFQVYYQPKISLKDYRIIGAEALVRWIREDGTMLRPDFFIPLYEKNGRIVDLDFYVFEEVAAFIQKNRKEGSPMVPISVNVSALHSGDEDTTEKYLKILEKYDVEPSQLEMELTETATVLQYQDINRLFGNFQKAGFHTSLDDFGAGYSILNLIMDVPLNVVKLDRIFIDKCDKTPRGIQFLKQIISMLKNLGFSVMCEGVEKEEQAQILKEAGCDGIQGNWFSEAIPEEAFVQLLKKHKK